MIVRRPIRPVGPVVTFVLGAILGGPSAYAILTLFEVPQPTAIGIVAAAVVALAARLAFRL